MECIAKEIILLKQGRILKKASPMELIREMDGLVWEFLIQPEEMAGVQKKYLVSNIMMTDAGMLVRAVGDGERSQLNEKRLRQIWKMYICIGWKQILDREWGKKNGTFGTFLI